MARRLWLCSWLVPTALATSAADGPVVNLGYAAYKGVFNENARVNIWHAIPYALPPTGEYRWRAPRPVDEDFAETNATTTTSSAAATVTDASQPGPACIHGCPAWDAACSRTIPAGREAEDCLRLDVLAPAPAPAPTGPGLLPVVVRIHGGGYVQGRADHAGGFGVVGHARGGVVYVAIQYRLGAYGFLGAGEVQGDGVANAGLLDQRSALEWVKRHIGRFGGDAERVTIAGGSAGGGSVTAQMMLYGAVDPPPFRAAIADYPWWQSFKDRDTLEAQYKHLLQAASCTDLPCLRALPEDKLAAAQLQVYSMGYTAKPKPLYGYGDYYFGPAVDGQTIWGLPSKEFEKGRFAKVPLWASHNKYEGGYFSNSSTATQEGLASDLKELFPTATQAFLDRLFALYPAAEYNSTFDRRVAIFGDLIVNCPTRKMVQAVNKHSIPAYKMVFNAGHGQHGAIYDPLFNTTYTSNPGVNTTLVGYLRDWWTSFAINYDPNKQSWSDAPSDTKPRWPVYGDSGSTLVVNHDSIGVAVDPELSEKCNFWQSQSDVVRNRKDVMPDYD